jgi:cytochrome b561
MKSSALLAYRQTMLQESPQDGATSRLVDTPSTYGWISIAIHWLTAATIIALWFLGQRIESAGSIDVDSRRALHVSIAASAWLVILFRIVWRLNAGHPKVRGQTQLIHNIAKLAHYLVLGLLLLMLVSGPLMVWAGGQAISVFDTVTIAAPIGTSAELEGFAHAIHSFAARGLFVLVLLHIAGALKHLMFHSDDTIVRMLWPGPAEDRQ